MPTKRKAMREIKEALRLRFEVMSRPIAPGHERPVSRNLRLGRIGRQPGRLPTDALGA